MEEILQLEKRGQHKVFLMDKKDSLTIQDTSFRKKGVKQENQPNLSILLQEKNKPQRLVSISFPTNQLNSLYKNMQRVIINLKKRGIKIDDKNI